MVIIDNRLGLPYGIQIKTSHNLDENLVNHWVSPFFSVCSDDEQYLLVAIINISIDNLSTVSYQNGEFFIPSCFSSKDILYNIMFLCRSIFKCVAHLQGYQNIHAGCLSSNNKGILITADRNQGKTTVILQALAQNHFSLTANDQLMLNPQSRSALGYPATIGIREGSCRKDLMSQIKDNAFTTTNDPFQRTLKPVIHFKNLQKLLHYGIESQTTIELLVHYQKSHIQDEFCVSELRKNICDFSELSFPISSAYSLDLYNSCMECINYHHQIPQCPNNICSPGSITELYLKCGSSRIVDMLTFIQERFF